MMNRIPAASIVVIVMALCAGFMFAQTFERDLLNLEQTRPGLTASYFQIKLKEVWSALDKANPVLQPVTIGVVDSGVDLIDGRHPEFEGVKFGETPDVARTDHDLEDGHGTKVAGIIGANNISAAGDYEFPHMNGVLSGAKNIDYTLEIRHDSGFPFTSPNLIPVITSLNSLKKAGVDVVNLSIARSFSSAILCNTWGKAQEEAFRRVFQKSGGSDILFVLAAGNTPPEDVECSIPASLGNDLPNVVTASAVTLDDKRFGSSLHGEAVGISAPGEAVYTPAPRGTGIVSETIDYDRAFNDTSAATPFVTGVAGLIKAIRPELTPAQIKEILVTTADPIQTGEPDKRIGTGCYADPNDPVNTGCRLNALKAVCHGEVLDCVI